MHQLRYFVAVAERHNFTRAAESCHVAQPSLSQQILKLENELGQPLFDRLGRKVLLTDAGERFYGRAKAILEAVEEAKREAEDCGGDGGRITIGAILTVAPYMLPGLLRRFQKAFPEAEVVVQEDLTERLIAACLAGEIDGAILSLPIDDRQLRVEPLLSEPLLLATPPGHPLAGHKRVDIEDLNKEPFILLDPIHCLGELILSFCRGRECRPTVACRSSQLLTVQELVALGNGVSLLPRMACDADQSGRIRYRPLSGVRPKRTIVMISHRQRFRSRCFEAFVKMAKETCV